MTIQEAKKIYIDASFDPKSQLAVGGYWLQGAISTTVLRETNSTCAEILTAIWAISSVNSHRPVLYTDCQSLLQLLKRRERLEASDFWSQRSSKPLAHSQIYREFFAIVDQFQPRFFKLKGHTRQPQSSDERIFAEIDRAVRRHLRGLKAR